jgi:hypothetical protein
MGEEFLSARELVPRDVRQGRTWIARVNDLAGSVHAFRLGACEAEDGLRSPCGSPVIVAVPVE